MANVRPSSFCAFPCGSIWSVGKNPICHQAAAGSYLRQLPALKYDGSHLNAVHKGGVGGLPAFAQVVSDFLALGEYLVLPHGSQPLEQRVAPQLHMRQQEGQQPVTQYLARVDAMHSTSHSKTSRKNLPQQCIFVAACAANRAGRAQYRLPDSKGTLRRREQHTLLCHSPHCFCHRVGCTTATALSALGGGADARRSSLYALVAEDTGASGRMAAAT